MTRKTASDFDPEVLKLFDQYVHGDISRRSFLQSTGKFAVGAFTAEAILEALSPRFAEAQQIKPDDQRITTRYVEYPSPEGYGTLRGYLAQPAHVSGKLPTILVVHENRGLNPHIEDITRRLALENYIAFAPDGLFTLGGYPGDEDKARDLFGKLDQNKSKADFIAAADVLKNLPQGNGKVGVVGFCYGGSIANYLASRLPYLSSAVAFYGAPPATADIPNIKARLLIHHAGKDERLMATWPGYEAALKAAGIHYSGYVYPSVEHGFNNDTTPRFDDAAAKLAWQRTLTLFNDTLRA